MTKYSKVNLRLYDFPSGHATPVRTWDLSASDFSNILGTAHKSKETKKNRPLPLSPQPLFRNFLIFTFNQVNTFQ